MPQDSIKTTELQIRAPEVDMIEDIEKIKELQAYLDTVKKITRPDCSEEVLKVATDYVSSLVRYLSVMSSTPKPRPSL